MSVIADITSGYVLLTEGDLKMFAMIK